MKTINKLVVIYAFVLTISAVILTFTFTPKNSGLETVQTSKAVTVEMHK